LLDIGCGPGTDMITIAQVAGEDCLVVGLDYDESMTKLASERTKASKVTSHVQHVIANALAIP
jgi:ubiquinone/menaquinone biosynthesis C-methylase UbiE